MNALLDAALRLQQFCQEQRWQFCWIGGLAVQRWGEPRFTQDADMTLLTGFGHEETYVDRLLNHYTGRLPDARQFALQYRVLLLQDKNGIPLDIALGAMPFEEKAVQRASVYEIASGYPLLICSAEDLIVHKAFASRAQDWLDIETILIRQRGQLDFTIVWDELIPLANLKEDPQIVPHLEALIKKVEDEQ
jgi:hypothetical protein